MPARASCPPIMLPCGWTSADTGRSRAVVRHNGARGSGWSGPAAWPVSVARRSLPGGSCMTPSHAILARAALLGGLMLLLVGAPVAAHADLEGSDPADGDTVVGGPAELSGAFTEPLDPAASRLVLVDEAGERLAEGGVDPEDASATTMRLEPPLLAPGLYEVRWTARTPDDGFVARGHAGASRSRRPRRRPHRCPARRPARRLRPASRCPAPSPVRRLLR